LKFTSSKVKFAKNVPSGAYRKVIQEYKKWKFKWTTKIINGEPALDTMITDTCKCQPINESCHFNVVVGILKYGYLIVKYDRILLYLL
jgi:hypothetical protein